MNIKFSCICPLLFLLFLSSYVKSSQDTLELLHVIFRHGDRTNDIRTIYPKDPYKNDTYLPYGLGQLTNNGKMKMYRLGKTLRKKYGNFLGDVYTSQIIDSRCSSYSRTKISLMLVLAGLFQPKETQIWNPDLNWQPVTFKYYPKTHDLEYFGISCPNYHKHYRNYYTSQEYQDYLKKYTGLFAYLSFHSGWNVSTLEAVNYLSICLQIEEHWGFRLPEWTKSVWPKKIRDANHDYFYEATATNNLIRYAVGFLLKKILNDTHSKINGGFPARKAYLYSGHDYNLVFMLRILGLLTIDLEPTFASYMAIEVHKIKGVYGLKFFYENYSNPSKYLQLPDCGTFCPIEQFLSLMKDYIPTPEDLCGREDTAGSVNEKL